MKPTLIALLLAGVVAQGADDWPAYGRDGGGTRYSPLKQMAAFEATPVLFEGNLYLSTPFDQVIALDPATGAERWKYDPDVDRRSNYSEVSSRGVSAWADKKAAPGAPCRSRIFVGSIDA